MITEIRLYPFGWPCSLRECPPGHFLYRGNVFFKTEYGKMRPTNQAFMVSNEPDAYCMTGEHCTIKSDETVQPLSIETEFIEDVNNDE